MYVYDFVCTNLSVAIPQHTEIKTQHSRILNNYVLNDGLHMQIQFQDDWHTFVHSLTFNSLTCEALDSNLSLQDTSLYWLTADFQMKIFLCDKPSVSEL